MTLFRPAFLLLLLLSAVTGVAYPLAVTSLARALFPAQAAGSLIMRDGSPVGSSLIGQQFDDPRYFWGRPSATAPFPYNAGASSGSNLGPLNPALETAIAARVAALRQAGGAIRGRFRSTWSPRRAAASIRT
jgi:K+-transporting ATPase ATPase C chain